MINILVTGSNGQLGSEIRQISSNYPEYNFFFTNVKELDISDHNAVKDYVFMNKISGVINCAAYTAVDKAESEKKKSNDINHLAVYNIAQIVKEKKIKFIHVSTDYVFNGLSLKPYAETDTPNPQTVYGKTKLEGEIAIQQINPPYTIILRTSWVYSKFGNNFVKNMLRLAKNKNEISVVNDQKGSPTNAADLAKVILKIFPNINNKEVEIYHYSNKGECSWYDFAEAIFDINKKKVSLKPTCSDLFKQEAKRPKYSVLDSSLIEKKFSVRTHHWFDSLKQYFDS